MAKKNKSRRPDKHIVLTQAKARDLQEEIYWEVLEMFLAAAHDLHGWDAETIQEYAVRVNWYFSAQHVEKTISEEFVHKVLEENSGIIMERVKAYSGKLDIDPLRDTQAPAPAANASPFYDKPIKAWEVSCKGEQAITICFAATANEARSLAKRSRVFTDPQYKNLHAVRFPALDGYKRRKQELDWNNAKDIKAARSAGIIFDMEV